MREPFALLSGLAFAAASGGLAILWPTAAGYTLAVVLLAVAFWLVLSRDASFEREIDDLLHEHARIARVVFADEDNPPEQLRDGVVALRIITGDQA